MAGPITWRNVNQRNTNAADLLRGARTSVNAGFSTLGQLLSDAQAIQANNVQVAQKNRDDNFRDTLASFRSVEELDAAQQAGAFDNLDGISRELARSGVQGRRNALQQNLITEQAFQDAQETRDDRIATEAFNPVLEAMQSDLVRAEASGDFSAFDQNLAKYGPQIAELGMSDELARMRLNAEDAFVNRGRRETEYNFEQGERNRTLAIRDVTEAADAALLDAIGQVHEGADHRQLIADFTKQITSQENMKLLGVNGALDRADIFAARLNQELELTQQEKLQADAERKDVVAKTGVSTNSFYRAEDQDPAQAAGDLFKELQSQSPENSNWADALSDTETATQVRGLMDEVLTKGIVVDGTRFELTPEQVRSVAQRAGTKAGWFGDLGNNFAAALQAYVRSDGYKHELAQYQEYKRGMNDVQSRYTRVNFNKFEKLDLPEVDPGTTADLERRLRGESRDSGTSAPPVANQNSVNRNIFQKNWSELTLDESRRRFVSNIFGNPRQRSRNN